MSEYIVIQKSTLVDIADTVRAKTGITDPIKISDINTDNEEIMSRVALPDLTNPASAQHILADYEVIDGSGKVMVGEMETVEQAVPSITVDDNGLITASTVQDTGYIEGGEEKATMQLPTQAAKTITPSTTSQTAVESGVYTTGAVTVAAIPSTYVKPAATKGATIYTPTTANQTIAAGTYCSGTQTIKGDRNLVASNIKSGVSIFGVNGTLEVGSGSTEADYSTEDGLIMRTVESCTNSRVTKIGDYAFVYCENLTTVNFPAVTTIGGSAFSACFSLTTANFPVATVISNEAFYMCENLATANFPATTTIGDAAFYDCISLTTANFPVATTIGNYAFAYCESLTTVSFPAAKTIDYEAFAYCASLTAASFPSATTIGSNAFYSCTNLATASFPTATIIRNSAFRGCVNLKSLYLMNSSVCKLSHSNAFSSTPIGGYSASVGTYGSIYVPASLLTSYKTATNWTYFSSRFVGI